MQPPKVLHCSTKKEHLLSSDFSLGFGAAVSQDIPGFVQAACEAPCLLAQGWGGIIPVSRSCFHAVIQEELLYVKYRARCAAVNSICLSH